jgi:hypothetical protein
MGNANPHLVGTGTDRFGELATQCGAEGIDINRFTHDYRLSREKKQAFPGETTPGKAWLATFSIDTPREHR